MSRDFFSFFLRQNADRVRVFFHLLSVKDGIARIDVAAVQDRRREKTCRGEETSRNRGSDPRRAQLGIPHAHLTDFLSPDAVIVGFGNSIRGHVPWKALTSRESRPTVSPSLSFLLTKSHFSRGLNEEPIN